MRPKWRRTTRRQGAEVSLSGNLSFVSLDEVLRLLIRSRQRGAVEVRGRSITGRVFVAGDGVDLATTLDDGDLREHLKRSGLLDESRFKSVEGGQATLADIANDVDALGALMREMAVESLYQLLGRGEVFQVYEAQTTVYAAPEPFELEALLADAHRREAEWAEVTRVIPDMAATVRFASDLGSRDRVEIPRDGWRVLTQVESGSSVREMAQRLGTTEFWTARVAADLVEDELLVVEYATPAAAPAVGEETAETVKEFDPNQSWWEEPEPEEEPEPTEVADDHVELADELKATEEAPPAEAPDYEVVGGPLAADEESSEVEEDTEAFLEKVFSELEGGSEDPDEDEEGFGLLRRRRMGALRDGIDEG